MNGHPSQDGQLIGSSGRNDVTVGPHSTSMHYAQAIGKRLLHRSARYIRCMTTPNERLKQARERFYSSAAEAARALNVPPGTYAGHENGHRGFPASRAPAYARKFKVSPEWLLYGVGDGEITSAEPTDEDLAGMIRNALDELPVGTPLGEFPRLVAPALRVQLERFRADRAG